MPIIDAIFEDNGHAQRTPCVVIVDGSYSMTEQDNIAKLNAALQAFEQALKADDEASVRVQVSIIRMGGDRAEVIADWCDAVDFTAPLVRADGATPMGSAVDLAMAKIAEIKEACRRNGTPYTRPWIFLMSDGAPTDADVWPGVADRCRQAQKDKKFILFPVAVGDNARIAPLQAFALDRPVVRSDAAKFREMFEWLSASLSAMSNSAPGQQVALPAPNAWMVADA